MIKKLKAAGLSLVLVYVSFAAYKTSKVRLRHFAPSEFGVWWPFVDDRLLFQLDIYRETLAEIVPGVRVKVSGADGAIGRLTGSVESQHYAGDGVVRAVDVMPYVIEGDEKRALTRMEMAAAVDLARTMFSGVGLYPEWKPFPGLHLDVRPDRRPGDPATWARVDVDGVQQYVSMVVGMDRDRWAA